MAYRAALQAAPESIAAHNNLGVALLTKGQIDEALSAFRTAAELQPSDPIAYTIWARPIMLRISAARRFNPPTDLVKGLDKILDAMERGYAIGGVSEGPSLTVRRRVTGRTVITNYDPMQLPNEERRLLHEAAQRYPRNYILIDIRPDGPIMRFLANGIAADLEFAVDPDDRTSEVVVNPIRTMDIAETESRPDDAAFAVEFEDRWYSITKASREDGTLDSWNLGRFRVLAQLYQMTVTDISKTPTPVIPIAN